VKNMPRTSLPGSPPSREEGGEEKAWGKGEGKEEGYFSVGCASLFMSYNLPSYSRGDGEGKDSH